MNKYITTTTQRTLIISYYIENVYACVYDGSQMITNTICKSHFVDQTLFPKRQYILSHSYLNAY